jgi:hypothetical protein
MWTRKEFVDGVCTLDEYYAQYIGKSYPTYVANWIGPERILNSTDPHLNDIPLKEWDMVPMPLGVDKKMREQKDWLTLAGSTCLAKTAARMFKEQTTDASET